MRYSSVTFEAGYAHVCAPHCGVLHPWPYELMTGSRVIGDEHSSATQLEHRRRSRNSRKRKGKGKGKTKVEERTAVWEG